VVPYYIWIPWVIAYAILSAFLAQKNNSCGGKWFYVLWAYTALVPMWEIISRFSKNIVFDSTLFDVLICTTYITSLVYFTRHSCCLTTLNYVGAALAAIGIILLRM
jgi:hypothetical protein